MQLIKLSKEEPNELNNSSH